MATTRAARSFAPHLPGFEQYGRVWDAHHGVYTVKILPGEFCVLADDGAVSTTLGSCVAACIRDRDTGVGGMNHFMLPEAPRSGQIGNDERYGTYAMERLINEVLKHGSGRRDRLEVKLTGGGRVLQAMTDIGLRNITFVRQFLSTDGLLVTSEDLGGTLPRRVIYFPATGRMRVKALARVNVGDVAQNETQYRVTLTTAPAAGDVELF